MIMEPVQLASGSFGLIIRNQFHKRRSIHGKTGSTLPNHITVKCPRRELTYVLEYTDGE